MDILTDIYATYGMYTKRNDNCEWQTEVPFFANMAGMTSRFNISNLENESPSERINYDPHTTYNNATPSSYQFDLSNLDNESDSERLRVHFDPLPDEATPQLEQCSMGMFLGFSLTLTYIGIYLDLILCIAILYRKFIPADNIENWS